MKHPGNFLTAIALLLVLDTSFGCRDYCRGGGYNIEIQHDGDVPAQIELRLSDGALISPDSAGRRWLRHLSVLGGFVGRGAFGACDSGVGALSTWLSGPRQVS
jgi:hypothetical protein